MIIFCLSSTFYEKNKGIKVSIDKAGVDMYPSLHKIFDKKGEHND